VLLPFRLIFDFNTALPHDEEQPVCSSSVGR